MWKNSFAAPVLVFLLCCGTFGQKTGRTPSASYQTIHEATIRADKAKTFYVLINAPNLATDAFKGNIKAILTAIAGSNGMKMSVEIFDDKIVLESVFADETKAASFPKSKARLDQEGLHIVAAFDGDLKTGPFPNTLYFYPGADPNTQRGEYMDAIQFNP